MKNRFCRNTKLSEEELGHVVLMYVMGSRASDAKKGLDAMGLKISRQTITTLFLDLGEYIYRRMFRAMLIGLYRDANPTQQLSDDEWEEVMLEQMWEHMQGTLDYGEFRKHNSPYPGDDVGLVGLLRIRWKFMNGFSRDKFKSHLGISCLHAAPEIPPTPEMHEQMANYVLHQLAEEPL